MANEARSASMAPAGNWLVDFLTWPALWATALTVGFYAAIPVLPVQRELAQRYFCSHPLEYVTTALFFLGMAILARKALGISTENASLTADPLANVQPAGLGGELAGDIERRLRKLPGRLRHTHLVRRLSDAAASLRTRGSAGGVEDQLKHLAEQADSRTHESYGLVRTISWAVPILGFLGTVMGITIAIANVTPEQLDTSLKDVTGGLAVAFDTTALALALSLVLVFASFLVQRAEYRVLTEVEDYAAQRLAGLLASQSTTGGGLAHAEQQAAEALLEKTEILVAWQTKLWEESLEQMRSRWNESLSAQQQRLTETLQTGTEATLGEHAQQLLSIREEFLAGFALVSSQLGEELQAARQSQRELQDAFSFQVDALWERLRGELAAFRDEERQRTAELIDAMSSTAERWQSQLSLGVDAAADQLAELRDQKEILLRLVEGEGQIARLEERLADNLDALRTAETFEQTLHSLSAAVHLLTARTTSKAA